MTDASTASREPPPNGWVILAGLIIAPVRTVLDGYVLTVIWNWFAWPVTPLRLTVPLAIGIMCLISCFKGRGYNKERWSISDYWSAYRLSFLLPTITLLTAAFAHHFAAHP